MRARSGGTANYSPAAPNWQKLMSAKPPALTPAEQAFLDGPCEELCAMLDDWDITHRRADLPAAVWAFIKSQGFFAMIIPRRYGGLEFSAYAHSCVLIKIASRSATASSTIAVPNSLGAGGTAASLRHRGAKESLLAAARARRRCAVLCAHRPARRFRRGFHSRHRRHLQGTVAGPGDHRHPPQFFEALHYAGAHRHGDRTGIPPLRSRASHGREGGSGDHLRADSARHARRRDRPAAFSLEHPVPKRPHPGTGRVRAAWTPSSAASRRRGRAGACWSNNCPWAAAFRCPRTPPAERRRPCMHRAPMRASAASSTRRSAVSRASSRFWRAWRRAPTSSMPRAR